MYTSENPKRFLFVRTFKMLKGGGPVPPLGILYLASVIRERFGRRFDIKIVDTGCMTMEEAAGELRRYMPDYVGISSLSCENDLMHTFAKTAKEHNPKTVVIAGGPHSMVVKEHLLDDINIDYVAIGEAERTIVELLETLENSGDPGRVDGIALRNGNNRVTSRARSPIEDLDSLPFPAWDLIDIKDYARYPNWNGALKEDFYATLITSRGCPYGCFFCHNVFGKSIRARSPESVVAEMKYLHQQFRVREFHIIDDIFNFDEERAKRICKLIINSGIRFSLAFPNGLRADIMTKDLIMLLRRAGTYKINYGFETTSQRLQKMIGKNLDIPKTIETIKHTSKSGIITGAYFMLGFPNQTREEMMETIEFAANSNLDVAYFFKATPYPGSRFFESTHENQSLDFPKSFSDYHFYSVNRSYGEIDTADLNKLILLAQKMFYLRFKRLWCGFFKASHKLAYIRNLFVVFALLIQSYFFETLTKTVVKHKS